MTEEIKTVCVNTFIYIIKPFYALRSRIAIDIESGDRDPFSEECVKNKKFLFSIRAVNGWLRTTVKDFLFTFSSLKKVKACPAVGQYEKDYRCCCIFCNVERCVNIPLKGGPKKNYINYWDNNTKQIATVVPLLRNDIRIKKGCVLQLTLSPETGTRSVKNALKNKKFLFSIRTVNGWLRTTVEDFLFTFSSLKKVKACPAKGRKQL